MGLSAETGRLASTPNPRGKPGGPGLYHVKGNMHSPYMQNLVKALIRKGHPPGEAYAIAWGSLRRWSKGGGKVRPEVRAAAAGSLGLEKAAEAVGHAHAVTWDDVADVIDLVGPGGWSHGWVYHGAGGMAPEDKADRMSRNISGHAFSDGPDGDEARSANREAAKAHRQAARLSSSPAAVAHHEKMARLHAAVAGGRMYSYNAAKQMSVTYGWDEVALVVDLAYNPDQQRAAGGKFGSGGATTPTAAAGKVKTAGPVAPKKPLTAQQQAAQQQQAAKASATAKATAAATIKARAQARKVAAALKQAQKPPKPDAHQLHVLHMQNLQHQAAARMQAKTAAKEAGGKAAGAPQTRAGLLGQAASDRKQAGVLAAQRKVLQGELASASGTTSSGQSGSTTSAGASTTASTAPAVAATPATPAAASTTPAASTTAASSAASSTPTAAQLTTAITGLTSQINALLASATAAQAQAAKMSGGAAPPVATAK